MSRLVETEALIAVVQEGSFAAAGERLGISSSYVSKLVNKLEERLGARLLHRTTRRLTLTEMGVRFYEAGAKGLELFEAAEAAVQELQVAPRGRLRVTLPTSLGLSWLSDSLATFCRDVPTVLLDIVYLDRFVDLLQEGFDVAVRVGHLPDSSLTMRRLSTVPKGLFASPEYLERAGMPIAVEDIEKHACLCYSYSRSPTTWELHRGADTRKIVVSGPIIANSGSALARAAAQGLGIIYLPDIHTEGLQRSGGLVPVLPEWGASVPVQALYPSAQHVAAKVRVFVDHLARCLNDRAASRT